MTVRSDCWILCIGLQPNNRYRIWSANVNPDLTDLSPLDQIRLVEAEITRRIIAAREASERALTEARAKAALIKDQAHESGTQQGRLRHKEIVSKAEEEAHVILAQGHRQATVLRHNGDVRMELAVHEAINIVLGLKGDRQSNEP